MWPGYFQEVSCGTLVSSGSDNMWCNENKSLCCDSGVHIHETDKNGHLGFINCHHCYTGEHVFITAMSVSFAVILLLVTTIVLSVAPAVNHAVIPITAIALSTLVLP